MAQLKRIDPTAENLARVAEVLYKSFRTDPVNRAMTCHITNAAQEDAFRREQWFPRLVRAAALADAEFYAVDDDFKGISIWLQPGRPLIEPLRALRAGLHIVFWHLGWKGVKRIMSGAMQDAERVQRDVCGIKNHDVWYCFFVAVLPEHQGKGLSKILMSPHTPVAGLPLSPTHDPKYPAWLESTTQKSQAVYRKLGFEDIETVRFAAGETDDDGYAKAKGPGVPMYCMILRDTSQK